LLWEKAIQDELATLKATGTWRLEEAPLNANTVGSESVAMFGKFGLFAV
jgi:hypothetical protein